MNCPWESPDARRATCSLPPTAPTRRWRTKLLLTVAVAVGAAATTGAANAGHTVARESAEHGNRSVRVALRFRSIDLFHSASVRVSGISARTLQLRPVGAIDRAGRAYAWTPYHWRALRFSHGTWRGQLPAPPLLGTYRLQLCLDHGRRILSSARWLLRVFPSGTLKRPSFPSAVGAVRDFVADLPGHKVLVALKRWPLARFDHRDPRMNRLYVIAYAPRGDDQPSVRRGLFLTTARDGLHGRWRLLQATTRPYD